MDNDETNSGQTDDPKVVHGSLLCQEPLTYFARNYGPSSLKLPPKLKSLPSEAFVSQHSLALNHVASSIQGPGEVSEEGSSSDKIGNSRLEVDEPKKSSSPQHLLNQRHENVFFQVVFRGVVSLLHAPGVKSGVYIGYGEIFEGHVLEVGRIRVHNVLTGAYAVDSASASKNAAKLDRTPKRTNSQTSTTTVRTSPMTVLSGLRSTIDDETSVGQRKFESRLGYIMSNRGETAICVPLDFVPHVEEGEFIYSVVSSHAVTIRTGPALDAPCTTGTLLPGTSHEICLRVLAADRSLFFLRLARQRGWILEKRQSRKYPERLVRVMQEITDTMESQSCNVSFASRSSSSSVATPINAARLRHRPPRRHRDMKAEAISRPKPHVDASSSFRQGSPNNSFDTGSLKKNMRSPSSNISMLSEESSLPVVQRKVEETPERQSNAVSETARAAYFLIRVTAPRGLKILDAPHFQVNNLIHGKQNPISSNFQGKVGNELGTMNQSIFQTMTGYRTTALTTKTVSPAVFDSVLRARKLPRGCVFEASKRMESTGAFGEGDGLIKLSDKSGWAIVPKQEELEIQYKTYSGSRAKAKEGEATRAFEEVGNAFVEEKTQPMFMRVHAKGGIAVSCPSAASSIADDETSITSPGSSVAGASAVSLGFGHAPSHDSDMTSSVGSSFIDAMFRTPKKKDADHSSLASSRDGAPHLTKVPPAEKSLLSTVIPCGMYFQVDPWVDPTSNVEQSCSSANFTRIRGGHGWIPRSVQGKAVVNIIQPPIVKFGSFWFRVSQSDGIKVRKGPSRRAPSIRREDGVYFRFECGEYLRASEVVTFSRDDVPYESFAKLFRNRHVRLQPGQDGTRTLASLTLQSEWVQISCSETTHLVECAIEPRIERQYRQGWRYNVVLDAKIMVRRGPSFEADTNDIILSGGETVLVNERVMVPGDNVTWLRLRDGQGWAHNVGLGGEVLMIPHTLKHRRTTGAKQSRSKDEHDDIAYNTIVARLFHNESNGN